MRVGIEVLGYPATSNTQAGPHATLRFFPTLHPPSSGHTGSTLSPKVSLRRREADNQSFSTQGGPCWLVPSGSHSRVALEYSVGSPQPSCAPGLGPLCVGTQGPSLFIRSRTSNNAEPTAQLLQVMLWGSQRDALLLRLMGAGCSRAQVRFGQVQVGPVIGPGVVDHRYGHSTAISSSAPCRSSASPGHQTRPHVRPSAPSDSTFLWFRSWKALFEVMDRGSDCIENSLGSQSSCCDNPDR